MKQKLRQLLVFFLLFGVGRIVYAGSESEYQGSKKPLFLCADSVNDRLSDLKVKWLFDLYSHRNPAEPGQSLPGFLRTGCQRGLEKFMSEQEFVKNLTSWANKNFKYLMRDQLVIRKDEEKTDYLLVPSEKELEPRVFFQSRFKLVIDTDGEKLKRGDFWRGATPALKVHLFYKEDVLFNLRVNPLRKKVRLELSSDKFIFGVAKPDFKYKVRSHENNRQIFELGVIINTKIPDFSLKFLGEYTPKRGAHEVRLGVVWNTNWECKIFPSGCK